MKILMVDDEKLVLSIEEKRVSSALPDAEIYAFNKSSEALEFAETNKIDIAFLDINMSIVDGITIAKHLQSLYPNINIIFCTGYDEYMGDALDMYCSGYLLKPVTEEKIKNALAHLRYPIDEKHLRVVIQCLSGFEIFCDKKPVSFKYNRTKEMLAYLVYKNGADCTTLDIIAALFGDDVKRSYFNQLRADLIDSLNELGISDIIRVNRGSLGINKNRVSCDYFDYLDGKSNRKQIYDYFGDYTFAT